MSNGIKELFPSLVGASIDYSFKRKFSDAITIERNIVAAKGRILEDTERALSVGGRVGITLLAELLSYYSKQPYYMAVRSSIELRRYRPRVLEYLQLDAEQRAEILQKHLSVKSKGDRERDLKISALRYFLETYKSRVMEFRPLLTREEFLIVS